MTLLPGLVNLHNLKEKLTERELKVLIDTFEHERMIRSLAKFDCNKDKWITLWEHEFNERFEEFKSVLGEEVIDSLPDRLDPRNAVKGG